MDCKDAVLTSAVDLNESLFFIMNEQEQSEIQDYLQRLVANLERG